MQASLTKTAPVASLHSFGMLGPILIPVAINRAGHFLSCPAVPHTALPLTQCNSCNFCCCYIPSPTGKQHPPLLTTTGHQHHMHQTHHSPTGIKHTAMALSLGLP